jgi:hypothetical protein
LPAPDPAPTIDGALPIDLSELAEENCSGKLLAHKNSETRSAFVLTQPSILTISVLSPSSTRVLVRRSS